MNRRNFLRAVAVVPVAAVAAPLAIPTVAAATSYETFRDWMPIDWAARSEVVSMAFRAGLISAVDARTAMGLSDMTEASLQESMDEADCWLAGLSFPSNS